MGNRAPIVGLLLLQYRPCWGSTEAWLFSAKNWREQMQRTHSITSSARATSDGGTVRLSALAVLRLMTSSNFVGCSTGRSAGLAPFRILSTKIAARRQISLKSGP